MTIEAWRAAAAALAQWDGRLETARAAVDAALALEALKGKPDPADAALVKQLSALRKQNGKAPGPELFPLARAWIAGTRRWNWREEAAVGVITYRLALGLDDGDEDARRTVASMGYLLEDPDDMALGLLCDLLCYRPRASWRSAALALSRHVTHAPRRREALARFLDTDRPSDRHRLVVSFAAWARGTELSGRGEAWLRAAVSKAGNPDNLSAVLGMAGALADDTDVDLARVRAIAEAAIAVAARFAKTLDYQFCAALRDVATVMPETMTPAAWGLLLDAPPMSGGALVGAWIDAGATALWLSKRPNGAEPLARLRAGRLAQAPEVEDWALAAEGSVAPRPPVEAAIERLRLLRTDYWRTTAPQARSVALAELVWILRHPDLAETPWDALASRAGLPARGASATVAEVADAVLLEAYVGLERDPWAELRHAASRRASPDSVVALAAGRRRDGRVEEHLSQMCATLVMRTLLRAEVEGMSGEALANFLVRLVVVDLNAGAMGSDGLWEQIRDQLPGLHGRMGRIAAALAALDGDGSQTERPTAQVAGESGPTSEPIVQIAQQTLTEVRELVTQLRDAADVTTRAANRQDRAAARGPAAERESTHTDAGEARRSTARIVRFAHDWIEVVARECALPLDANGTVGKAEQGREGTDGIRFADFAWTFRMARRALDVGGSLATGIESKVLVAFAERLTPWLDPDSGRRDKFVKAARDMEALLRRAAEDHKITDVELDQIRAALEMLKREAAEGSSLKRSTARPGRVMATIIEDVADEILAWAMEQHGKTIKVDARRRLLRDLIDAGDERQILAKFGSPDEEAVQAHVGELGRFWLRRLEFSRARLLRKHQETVKDRNAAVPTALEYYAPLLVGIAGGPLATIQIDALVTNMINITGHRMLGSLLAFGGAFFMLINVLRSNAPGLTVPTIVRRAALPGTILLAFTAVISGLVWFLKTEDGKHDRVWVSLVVWTSLSLFQGVFLGLIAQGSSGTKDD